MLYFSKFKIIVIYIIIFFLTSFSLLNFFNSKDNFLLSKNNLKIAGSISKELNLLKKKINKNYKLKKEINYYKNYITKKYSVKIDYLETRNEKDLSIFKKKKKFRLFVAYNLGKVRLIDNY